MTEEDTSKQNARPAGVASESQNGRVCTVPPPVPPSGTNFRPPPPPDRDLPPPCRLHMWGKCIKGHHCRFRHKYSVDELKKVIKFCHNYQNKGCAGKCDYLHASLEEQDLFNEVGQYPRALLERHAAAAAATAAAGNGPCVDSFSIRPPPPPPPPAPAPPPPGPPQRPRCLQNFIRPPQPPFQQHMQTPVYHQGSAAQQPMQHQNQFPHQYPPQNNAMQPMQQPQMQQQVPQMQPQMAQHMQQPQQQQFPQHMQQPQHIQQPQHMQQSQHLQQSQHMQQQMPQHMQQQMQLQIPQQMLSQIPQQMQSQIPQQMPQSMPQQYQVQIQTQRVNQQQPSGPYPGSSNYSSFPQVNTAMPPPPIQPVQRFNQPTQQNSQSMTINSNINDNSTQRGTKRSWNEVEEAAASTTSVSVPDQPSLHNATCDNCTNINQRLVAVNKTIENLTQKEADNNYMYKQYMEMHSRFKSSMFAVVGPDMAWTLNQLLNDLDLNPSQPTSPSTPSLQNDTLAQVYQAILASQIHSQEAQISSILNNIIDTELQNFVSSETTRPPPPSACPRSVASELADLIEEHLPVLRSLNSGFKPNTGTNQRLNSSSGSSTNTEINTKPTINVRSNLTRLVNTTNSQPMPPTNTQPMAPTNTQPLQPINNQPMYNQTVNSVPVNMAPPNHQMNMSMGPNQQSMPANAPMNMGPMMSNSVSDLGPPNQNIAPRHLNPAIPNNMAVHNHMNPPMVDAMGARNPGPYMVPQQNHMVQYQQNPPPPPNQYQMYQGQPGLGSGNLQTYGPPPLPYQPFQYQPPSYTPYQPYSQQSVRPPPNYCESSDFSNRCKELELALRP